MSISLNDAWEASTGFSLSEQKTLDEKVDAKYMISLSCEEEATTTCTDADTWYDIDGLFADGSANGFTYVSQGGVMTKTGERLGYLSFFGSSELSIGTAAATITYSLFIDALGDDNWVEAERLNSHTNFTTNEGIKGLSTNGITDDKIPMGAKGKVMCKSSTAGVVITHHTLKVTSMEE